MTISRKVRASLAKASWIRRMFEEGARLKAEHGPENVFDFSLGNPVVEPPSYVIDALVAAAGTTQPGAHRYMQSAGYPEVREAVGAYLAEETGLGFEARNILMCTGAGGGLNVTLKTLLDPGDEVVLLAPFFVEYRGYVENQCGVTVPVRTDDDFQPDLAAIAGAITPRTRALIVNSPNNPTGVTYGREVLDGLGDVLRAASAQHGRDIVLITDEPYRHIAYDVEVPWLFHSYDKTVLVTSHSKDLALPGERIGYVAVGPGFDDVDAIVAAMGYAMRTLGFVNAPATQQRAVASLQGRTVDPAVYRRKRDRFHGALTEMGYVMPEPTGAFYMFPLSPVADDVLFVRALQEERILTVPGQGFDCPGRFRISYCVDDDTIEKALPGFARVAGRLGRSPARGGPEAAGP